MVLLVLTLLFSISLISADLIPQQLSQIITTQQTTQQTPSYFYPYYSQDPSIQYGFNPSYCNNSGMDFVVEILPEDCSPNPVSSDLLEENTVPVFCKLTGLKINPLIEVPYIEKIEATTDLKSKDIASVTYHPPASALSFTNQQLKNNALEGVPTISNLGYLVIFLKQQPVEAKMSTNVTLQESLKLTYSIEKSFGINENTFVLKPVTEKEWEKDYKQNSFWQGRGYLRVESLQDNKAIISVYQNQKTKIGTVTLSPGTKSNEIKMPGYYCGAGVEIQLNNIDTPKIRANLLVNGDELLVGENEKISDSGCKISTIYPSASFSGSIKITCSSGKKRTANIEIKNLQAEVNEAGQEATYNIGDYIIRDNKKYYIGYIGREYTGSSVRSYMFIFSNEGKEIKISDKEKAINAIESLIKSEKDKGISIVSNPSIESIILAELKSRKIVSSSYSLFMIKSGEIKTPNIELKGTTGLIEATYSPEIEDAFQEALDAYESVDYSYSTTESGDKTIYGIKALSSAADLADKFVKQETRAKYLQKIIDKYKDNENAVGTIEETRKQLANLLSSDPSKSSITLSTDSGNYRITLLSIEKPGLDSESILLDVDGEEKSYSLYDSIETWRIDNVEEKQITLKCSAVNCGPEENKIGYGTTQKLTVNSQLDVWDEELETYYPITLEEINIKKEADITVLPMQTRRETYTNFTVKIGIEKRAIKLNPEKTSEKVAQLNKLIASVDKIKDNLGKIVGTWNKVCFAGGMALWAKNFIQGLDGSALARKKVMNYWSDWCAIKGNRESVQASTVSGCYTAKASEINKDVDKTKEAINTANAFIKEVKSKPGVVQKSGFLGLGTAVNEEKFVAEAQLLLDSKYSNLKKQTITLNNKNIETEKALDLNKLKDSGISGTQDVKDIIYSLKMQDECSKSEPSEILCEKINQKNYDTFSSYIKSVDETIMKNVAEEALEGAGVSYIPFVTLPGTVSIEVPKVFNTRQITLDSSLSSYANKDVAVFRGQGFIVLAEVKKVGSNNYQIVQSTAIDINNKVFSKKEIATGSDDEKRFGDFISKITEVREKDESLCSTNPMDVEDRVVRFWETGPYKGMVAVMPVNPGQGYYIATQGYSGFEGSMTAVNEISGDIRTYVIGNVGPDGKIDFDFSTGQAKQGSDDCTSTIFLDQGADIHIDGITDQGKADAMNKQAIGCVSEARKKYGARTIGTSCGTFKLANPPAVTPKAQCEDFMSAGDCRIMYNLCDPVMCPASRCNLGGNYPVDNVFSTGIIGSLVLCLPNFENGKGVVVPICLTGLHRGVDDLSVTLKLYRDCLQKNIETGEMTGICDEITSIYLCQLFWKNIDPFLKIGLPSIVESVGNKGGGEYALFGESWKSSMDSINYFTQQYGIQTFASFKERSTAQTGTDICKRFISIAYPTQAKFWDEISKPASDPTFFASLSELEGIAGTQSHYKLYYQIYAGQDKGVFYRIYLKSPPTPGYYITPERYYLSQAQGYLSAGEYKAETPDFIAPQGYKEVCVEINGKEDCNFGTVSSNFAVNEIKDYYLKQQLEKSITKTKDCISGTPSFIPAPSLNLQSLAESTLEPEIYKQGVIRLCASEDPGQGTDEDRYKLVGYCDNKAVGCYLDMDSVGEAVKDLGVQQKIADSAEKKDIAKLIDDKGLDPIDVSIAKLNVAENKFAEVKIAMEKLEEKVREKITEQNQEIAAKKRDEVDVKDLTKDNEANIAKIEDLISELEAVSDKAIKDSQKAQADFDIAECYALIARIKGMEEIAKTDVEVYDNTCLMQQGAWKQQCDSSEEDITTQATDAKEHPNEKCCKAGGANVITPENKFTTWIMDTKFNIGGCYKDRNYKDIGIGVNYDQGNFEIKAVSGGEVIEYLASDNSEKYGYEKITVTIKHHETLYSKYIIIRSGVLRSGIISKISMGSRVNEGDVIAISNVGGLVEFAIYEENPVENKNALGKNPFCYFSNDILSQLKGCEQDIANCGGISISGLLSQWPTDYLVVESNFGNRIINGKTNYHDGIDIQAATGDKIYAVADGKVIFIYDTCTSSNCDMNRERTEQNCGCNSGYGNSIIIKHNNGLTTAYQHLETVNVKLNDEIKQGDIIATADSTGYSTGEHLDFKLYTSENDIYTKVNDKGKNPLCFFSSEIISKVTPKNFIPSEEECKKIRGDIIPITGEATSEEQCNVITNSETCMKTSNCWYDHVEIPGYGGVALLDSEMGTDELIKKYSEYPRCRLCPPNNKCGGDFNWFFDWRADITFRTPEDCEYWSDNSCGIQDCYWSDVDKQCKKAEFPIDKLESLINNFETEYKSSEALLNNPEEILKYSVQNKFIIQTKIETLKTKLDYIKKYKQENNVIDTSADRKIKAWETSISNALDVLGVGQVSEVIIVSSKDGSTEFNTENKIIEFNDNSRVCAILSKDGEYYNDELAKQNYNINGKTAQSLSATINWFYVIPTLSHEQTSQDPTGGGGFTQDICPNVNHLGDQGIDWNGMPTNHYCFYQNVDRDKEERIFWTQGNDTIQYVQSPAGTGWCIDANKDYGTYRYRAQITADGKSYSSLGQSLKEKDSSMKASEAGYGQDSRKNTADLTIFDGKEDKLLEPEAYDFKKWGASENIHRISRLSNYQETHLNKYLYTNLNQLEFIEYVEAYKGIVWIWGADENQPKNFIGMECCDLPYSALNSMLGTDVYFEQATSISTKASTMNYDKVYYYNPLDSKIYEYDQATNSIVKEVQLIAGSEGINVGDMFLLSKDGGKTFYHTLIFYDDSNINGYFDKSDLFIYVGKTGIIKDNYFKDIPEGKSYFVIRRLNQLTEAA